MDEAMGNLRAVQVQAEQKSKEVENAINIMNTTFDDRLALITDSITNMAQMVAVSDQARLKNEAWMKAISERFDQMMAAMHEQTAAVTQLRADIELVSSRTPVDQTCDKVRVVGTTTAAASAAAVGA